MPKPKKDAVLAEAVDVARSALREAAEQDQIAHDQVGEHVAAVPLEDRLLTHRFAAERPGYRGWEWFVTVARAPWSKKVTVCELGLLPGEDALLAPEWIPWAERMDEQEKKAVAGAGAPTEPVG